MNFIYQKITNLIIDKLNQGIVPWQKTWRTQYPKNFVSNLEYKGINSMILGLSDYESSYWLSFKQCKDLGGSIKKGEQSSMVVFWKPIVRISDKELDESSADIQFLLRYYYVWNTDQCFIPDEILSKKHTTPEPPRILTAEQVIDSYTDPPEIKFNNTISCPRYLPRIDKIEIHSIDQFRSSEDYYAALFHELVHSSGAKHRLCRRGITDTIQFGSENYSKEELVAEIGASYLCNISGIQNTIDNHASYIGNWLKALKNDQRMIFIAASQAQKACDYILNKTSNSKFSEAI